MKKDMAMESTETQPLLGKLHNMNCKKNISKFIPPLAAISVKFCTFRNPEIHLQHTIACLKSISINENTSK